jgi:hypothetical protein
MRTAGLIGKYTPMSSSGTKSWEVPGNGSDVLQGRVSKVEMTIFLHCPSKGIAVDKQANDDVMHLCRFRKADSLADEAFHARS